MSVDEQAPTGLGRVHPRLRSVQLPVVITLTVVWVLLWGRLSVGNLVGGVVVAVLVCVVFPLPPLHMKLRVRPIRLGVLVARFAADVVVASIEVATTVLRFGRQPASAVVEIDLRTRSDFVLTVVAMMVSLVPGSLVLEARRSTHTLFLHVLEAHDEAGAERIRGRVLALERRVVLALGAEIAHLDEPRSDRRPPEESP